MSSRMEPVSSLMDWMRNLTLDFSGLFGCCFATVQLLNSYCFARGVGGGGFRVFFGSVSLRGGLEGFGWFSPYSFLNLAVDNGP